MMLSFLLAAVQTPLMGWSSWNTFAVDISEDIIVGVAEAMSTNGLKAVGYRYVNIDDGFFGGHGEDGILKFHPTRFPNGMKGTVDRIHALGMKAGIYSEGGADTCGASWNNDKSGYGSGMYGHDAADCKLFFNDLDFDFIKIDFCGGMTLKLDTEKRYREIAAAIRATGKDVRFNICRWAFPGAWAGEIAGSWRTTRDIRASWESVRDIIAENLYLSAFVSPGHYNDLDMLEVGQYKGALKSAFGKHGDVGLTPDEEVTHFGMWCILSSPLVLGNDVRVIPATTLKLVTNPHLVAMNQDPLGLQAYVVSREGEAYVLVKDCRVRYGKSRYVALYNANDVEQVFELKSRDVDLGGKVKLFNLVKGADEGEFEGLIRVKVAPHASRFYRLDAERRLDRELYEAETAFVCDYTEIVGESTYGDFDKIRDSGMVYFAQDSKASGGVLVRQLGKRESNALEWRSVKVSKEGKYQFTIRYQSPEDRNFTVKIDGGAERTVVAPKTGDDFVETSFEVILRPGVHTVRLANGKAAMPDVDYLRIVKCP